MGDGLLHFPVLLNGVPVEILPEGTSMTAPSLSIWHDTEAKATPRPVWTARHSQAVNAFPENSQFYHRRLNAIRRICRLFIEILEYRLSASQHQNGLSKHLEVEDIPFDKVSQALDGAPSAESRSY